MVSNAARTHVETVVLPFWLDRGIDEKVGGFFTCFDNRGREMVSTDKFTWSQGRFVWLLARAADLGWLGLLNVDSEQLLHVARRGAQFLVDHAIRANGTTRFVVGRDGGTPQAADPPDRSVYADWFVAMGLSELARVSGETVWLDQAMPVLKRARTDHLTGRAPTPPYEVPRGHSAYGPKMILANTLLVVAQTATHLHRHAYTRDLLAEALDEMLAHRQPNATFTEMHGPDPDSLVSRHRVPGHAIEGLWVALEALELLGDDRDRRPLLKSVLAMCNLGWDREYGGILRYTDTDRPGQPSGTTIGSDYEQLVSSTWSSKLWWVHSEAAATTAIAAYRYDEPEAEGWFQRIWKYTLETFPAGDAGAEWIQIRDRTGEPMDQVVALPVKDPFHIARNLMQIIELQVPAKG